LIPANEIPRQFYSSIANRYDNGESVANIAKDYTFVNQKSIRRVCKRETWKHIK